jgi:hypothetical protein
MFKPSDIKIGTLKVNNVDHLGSISFGSTVKVGRSVNAKKNQGFGQQLSDYTVQSDNLHYVLDKDSLDKYTIKINRNQTETPE